MYKITLTVIILNVALIGISVAFPATTSNGIREIEEQGIDSGLSTTPTVAPFDLVNNHNGFGIGAAAGFGGIGASAGLGSFQVDPKSDPFLPFGAFAGINLPNSAGRIGAGCTGLNCGVQLGEFVLQVPNLFSLANNITRQIPLPQQSSSSFSDAVGIPSSANNNKDDIQQTLNNDNDTNKTSASLIPPPSILRTRNDGNINTDSNRPSFGNGPAGPLLEQGTNLFRTLLGGLRDFRTTFAGFFREPENKSITRTTPEKSTSSTSAPITITSASTSTSTRSGTNASESTQGEPSTVVPSFPSKIETSENEVRIK